MIHNESKRTISTNGGLELLQMISELIIEQCASENVRLPRGVDCKISHWLERGTKHSLIRVWKPLPRNSSNWTISTSGGFELLQP